MRLPDGLSSRPLTKADARAVFEVIAAQEREDIGSVEIEEADIVADWQRPSFDVEAGTVGVFEGDRLVAYAEVGTGGRGDAAVHPDHRGRGLGTQLATWMQDLARRQGHDVVGMPVPQGSPGDRLLESLGYFVRWTSWVLQLPEGEEIAFQPLPEGYRIRTVGGEADQRAAHAVVEDAFLEWSVREREPFEDFVAEIVGRPGFEPWQLRVVVDPADEVVGVCVVSVGDFDYGRCGFVSRLAVRRDQRGQGLAKALLADAFSNAREHGAVRSELSTDSRTGALGLYEKVGMVVTSTWVNRAIKV